MRFTYRSGERPLDGFTIKRGVGQGGFGEVYFAVSDSGKEVALKLLRGGSDIELRGVANCLNLKHNNLVHIYDLKKDGHGEQWLVMEYVQGESLGHVIDRHPDGLPVNLAVEFFQNLARAVAYLHEHGVVHRDLKPANIFLEHGNLKVGDYGLCKAMSASNRKMTKAVGTVNYMAPEIGSGDYSKSIDVYACGVILYEMLTGKLPFEGQTDAEIIKKHLFDLPELDPVPEPFRAVIAKALDKTAARRYATLAEMAKAVDDAYPTQPIAPLPPMASKVNTPIPLSAIPVVPIYAQAAERPIAIPVPIPVLRKALPIPIPPKSSGSGIGFRERLLATSEAMVKAPFGIALGVIAWSLLAQTTEWASLGKVFLVSLALCWAILISSAGVRYKAADTWSRRFRLAAFGFGIGLLAFWFDGGIGPEFDPPMDESAVSEKYLFDTLRIPPKSVPIALKYALYFTCVLGVARWWRMGAKDRTDRFSLFPPFVAAFWSTVLMFLWPWEATSPGLGQFAMILTAVVVQWVSPWEPAPPSLGKKRRYNPL